MLAQSPRRVRRAAAVAAAACLSGAGLSVASSLVVPAVPASAATACGNFGVSSVAGQTVTCTYTHDGADFFTVPTGDNITSIHVVAIGAGGGGGISDANAPAGTLAPGGSGARVTATLTATGGDNEGIDVGSAGQPGAFGGGGGGASSTVDAGAFNQVIAGGGGGAGEDAAGGNAGFQGGPTAGCTGGGGDSGFAGAGGPPGVPAGDPSMCFAFGSDAPQAGSNGLGGSGGNSVECCMNNASFIDALGGTGLGTGTGGSSADVSGGGGGGYGGGGGGADSGGGGGGGSVGGTITFPGNGGVSGAANQQTKGGVGGNGQVSISFDLPPAPTNINPPTISGTGHPGETLTCNTSASDWNGNPSEFSYEFVKVNAPPAILQGPVAGLNTYLLSGADLGRTVGCSVSAANNGGPSTLVASSNSIPVTELPPTDIMPPTISGSGHPGQTLTCNTSVNDWNGNPSQFSFKFMNGSSVLQGPTIGANTLLVGNADLGKTVSCSVSAINSGGSSPFVSSSNAIPVNLAAISVDFVDTAGAVVALDNPSGFHGSLPDIGVHVNDVVGIAATPDDKGYYVVGSDGGLFAFGDAVFHGSLPGVGVHVSDIAGMVALPAGGYLLFGRDGGVFAFGGAGFHGGVPGLGISVNDVVAVARTPDGGGYWLVRATGTVFHFGDAAALGNAPGGGIVSITATASGSGYWLTSAGGGVFCFGNATFHGSIPGLGLNVSDIITLVPSPSGAGYLLTGRDGGTFAFPGNVFPGSLASLHRTFDGTAPTS